MMFLHQPGLLKFPFLILEISFCRIILALDLEIWYLQSLKFVIGLKFLGPKLFMLKNMVCIECI
jgi:hypothetical protein